MLQKSADIALMNATSDALSNIALGDKATRSSDATINPASSTAEATSPQETNKQQQGIQTHPDGRIKNGLGNRALSIPSLCSGHVSNIPPNMLDDQVPC